MKLRIYMNKTVNHQNKGVACIEIETAVPGAVLVEDKYLILKMRFQRRFQAFKLQNTLSTNERHAFSEL